MCRRVSELGNALELRYYFRPRSTMGETVSLAHQRWLFCERFVALQILMEAVS